MKNSLKKKGGSKMKDVGVWFAKALPPHRGHLSVILNAATMVNTLYVIVSEHRISNSKLCEEAGIPYITGEQRVDWLTKELRNMPHIKVKLLDESNLPTYPNGWKPWTDELQKVVGEHIDLFFCGQKDINTYGPKLKEYFPDSETLPYNVEEMYFNISATEIRNNPIKHWDYILGPARSFFAKKILITGPSNCGKTILAKTLAKMYHTSWSDSVRFDEDALKTSNRVCFMDRKFPEVDSKYDAVFIINDETSEYRALNKLYTNLHINTIEVKGSYNERLNFILKAIKEIM
jgi:HTH-type transcriptional repressor of NAD biosynthesis genes